MGDNSIFSVFSNIWSSVRLKNPPSIPCFFVTKIVYIGYGQLKKWLLSFLCLSHSCAPSIFISYCCLYQCQAVCYYYMPVPTRYHWNISFQKKCSSKYVVKNARNVTQFVWQPFSIEFQGFVQKELNIYTRILDIMKL
jgi:hypothetical protein